MDTVRKKIADGIDGSVILGFSDETASDRRFVLVDVPGFFCNRANAFQATLDAQGFAPKVYASWVPMPCRLLKTH